MKKILTTTLVAMMAAFAPFSGSAQSLGDIVKQGTKVAETIFGKKDAPAKEKDSEAPQKAKSEVTNSGIEVFNPISSSIVVEPIGLYGVSTSETRGNAYLVMKVTNKEPKESVLIGSSIENKKMIAVDAEGNVYNIDAGGAQRYDAVQDIPVKVIMREPAMMFQNVDKNITVMPVVKVGVLIDAYHKGNLTFKNVPVYWDEEYE